MAVADVPVAGVVGLDATCSHCLPVLVLCLHLALDLLHDFRHRRGRVTSGDEDAVALCVCHVLSIEHFEGQCDPLNNLFRLVVQRLPASRRHTLRQSRLGDHE